MHTPVQRTHRSIAHYMPQEIQQHASLWQEASKEEVPRGLHVPVQTLAPYLSGRCMYV